MENPLAAAGRALYARLGAPPDDMGRPGSMGEDSAWAALFTRPASLALRDELPGDLPVRSLNRASLMLLGYGETSDLHEIARLCGFRDLDDFRILFHRATGWDPLEWQERFAGDQSVRVSGADSP